MKSATAKNTYANENKNFLIIIIFLASLNYLFTFDSLALMTLKTILFSGFT